MDLNNEIVKHKKFGVGTIVESKDDYIIVLFDETKERKKFLYPEAIGDFLELQNKSSSDNEELVMKDTETREVRENEHSRIKGIKGIIRRENGIKKIMRIRKDNEQN